MRTKIANALDRFFINKQLRTLILLSLLYQIVIYCIASTVVHYDTSSYVEDGKILLEGGMPLWRTPLYALIAALFYKTGHLLPIILLHYALLFVSERYLYLIVKRMSGSHRISLFMVGLYAFIPSMALIHTYVIAESVCMSMMVFALYLIVRIYDCGFTWKRGWGLMALCLITVMTRPSTIVVLCGVGILAIAMLVKKRRGWWWMVMICIATCAEMLGWCAMYQRAYGVFAPAIVTDVNLVWNARRDGVINPDVIVDGKPLDDELRAYVVDIINSDEGHRWTTVVDFVSAYPQKETHRVIQQWYDDAPGSRVGFVTGNVVWSVYKESLFWWSVDWEGEMSLVIQLFAPPFSMIYWFLSVYIAGWVWVIIKRRRVPWTSTIFLAIGVSNLAMVLWGGFDDFARLIIVGWPVYFAMMGQLLSLLKLVKPTAV